MNKDITFVFGSDWEGMYINGKLAVEGHRLDQSHILTALGIDYDYKAADDEWLWERGSLPVSLNCVVTDES